MGKKIAIMTFTHTWNVGAELQAYALVKAIKENFSNIEVEILNYDNEYISSQYQPLKLYEHLASPKKMIKFFLASRIIRNKHLLFSEFENKYIPFSNEKYSSENLIEAEERYSSFIVGSDQVWNLKLTNYDWDYTLSFIHDNTKKNSYAASFGKNELIIEERDTWNALLRDFNVLTSRENESTQLLNTILNTNKAQTVVDPTLLLTGSEWLEYFPEINKRIHKEKYILVYVVSEGDQIFNFANYLAQKYGYDIVFLNNTWRKKNGVKNVRSFGPIEFLRYLKNAEIVLVTSFHGLIFSTLFNKDFYCDLTEHSVTGSLRLRNLLTTLDLTDRIVTPNILEEKNEIDYSKVNKIILEERIKSLQILSRIIL